MKLKQRPEDFRVEEVSRIEAGADGAFALYRLEKSGIGTPEAVRALVSAWRLRRGDVAFAGLKDRHGLTGQMVSIHRGPKKNYAGRGFKLNYLGRSTRPAERGTIAANRFRIVLRDLSMDEAERISARARAAAANGFLNYYDDQRFGSLRGTEGRFVARALLDGEPEEALRLAVACPARRDRSRTKRRRKLLKARWGEWAELARLLDRSLERRIVEELAAGGTFAQAYELLDLSLRSLHLSALQAAIFNECLRLAVGPDGPRHPGVAGPYVFRRGEEELRGQRIPLASSDAPPHDGLDTVLAREELDRERLSRLDFRPGERDAVAEPVNFEAEDPRPDDLNAKRSALVLSLELPPGAYATMLLKRCTHDLKRG